MTGRSAGSGLGWAIANSNGLGVGMVCSSDGMVRGGAYSRISAGLVGWGGIRDREQGVQHGRGGAGQDNSGGRRWEG